MAVDGGVGDVNAATADDAVEDATVKVIEVSGRGGEAEANGAEGDRSEAFESGFGVDKLGEHLGEMEVVADGLLKCAQAEVANGEPEREGSEGTGKLDGFFEESKALDGVGGERAGVVAGMGEGTARISTGRSTGAGACIAQSAPVSASPVAKRQSSAATAKRSATTGPVMRKCVSWAEASPANSVVKPCRMFIPPMKAVAPSTTMIFRWVRRFA